MALYDRVIAPKKKANLLADEVPWQDMLLPGVILQKYQHGLQRSYAVRGPDLEGLSEEEQSSLMMQANDTLMRIGGRWVLQSEACRTKVHTLPAIAWDLPVPALIDEEHRAAVLQNALESRYTMTLSWIPPQLTPEKGLRFLVRGPGKPTARTAEPMPSLEDFLAQSDFFMGLLRTMLAHCRQMDEVETLTYLHNSVSDRWYPVGPLASWTGIDHQLCDTALDPAGWYPQLGRWHLRTCSLIGYPAQSLTGIMRGLERLGFEYRWVTTWKGMEAYYQQQMLKGMQKSWYGEEKTFMDRVGESMTREESRVKDTTATLKGLDVDAARQEVGMHVTAYGEFLGTITVWDEDPDLAQGKRQVVMETLANSGFTAHEEKGHQTAAWFSSFPGERRHNVHKSTHNTLTLAHLCPGLNAMWPGPERDDFLEGGPWLYAQTEGTSLFRLVNHMGAMRDLGHFLMIGATRSGKSTLLNLLRAYWMQYRHAQAKVFDVDGHARLLTYLLGGHWHDLGSPTLRLQPLRHIDNERRLGQLLSWMVDLCEEAGVMNTLLSQQYLASGLKKLALRPVEERTFTGLLRVFSEPPPGQQSAFNRNRVKVDGQGVAHLDTTLNELDQVQMHVRWVLQRFTRDGEYGGIFDGTDDPIGVHPVQTFELRNLLGQSRLLGPVMRYVMLEVRHQMSTRRPMFLEMDDAAIAWLAPTARNIRQQHTIPSGRLSMEQEANDWLQTTAKLKVSIGLATHSVAKVIESALGQILLESCKLQFFLPNPGATKKRIQAMYEEMGLSGPAIQTIARGRPQRDVLVVHEEMGQRLISVPQGPFTLACTARNSADDHETMTRLLAEVGPARFPGAWFRHTGHLEAAARVDTWQQRRAQVGDDDEASVMSAVAD